MARLFDPEHEIIATFANAAEMQEWTQRMARERPDLQRQLCRTPNPWDDSVHLKMTEQVRATGKPKVYITRPTRDEDLQNEAARRQGVT